MSITSETRAGLPTGTWELDLAHSTIGFELPYLGGTFRGHFRDADATFDGENGILEGAARVASLDVKDENLAAHLQSPDFFDAERHPELRFRSGRIEPEGDRVRVHGELTIRGETLPVELVGTVSGPITDGYGRNRIGVVLSTAVDRTAFGLSWNMELPSGEPALPHEVGVHAELYFVERG